jgi:hypothetical protein
VLSSAIVYRPSQLRLTVEFRGPSAQVIEQIIVFVGARYGNDCKSTEGDKSPSEEPRKALLIPLDMVMLLTQTALQRNQATKIFVAGDERLSKSEVNPLPLSSISRGFVDQRRHGNLENALAALLMAHCFLDLLRLTAEYTASCQFE